MSILRFVNSKYKCNGMINLRGGTVWNFIADNVDTAVSCDGNDRVKVTEINT